MNFVQIVGHITDGPEKIASLSNARYSVVHIEVTSNFRGSDGEFHKDIFPVLLWRGINDCVVNHCKTETLLAVKGRLEIKNDEFHIIAEHLEFLFPK